MTNKPHKQNEDKRSIVLKPHKAHIVSSDGWTDGRTDDGEVIPKCHLCLQQVTQNIRVFKLLSFLFLNQTLWCDHSWAVLIRRFKWGPQQRVRFWTKKVIIMSTVYIFASFPRLYSNLGTTEFDLSMKIKSAFEPVWKFYKQLST